MLEPVNRHLLIQPLVHEGFMASQHDTFEEIGTVLSVAEDIDTPYVSLLVGKKVYFDSWLAIKYPKDGSDDFYWLVKWEDVRAIDTE